MHHKLWLAAAATAAALTASAVPALAETDGDDNEVRVKFEDAPEAVRATLAKEAPGITITEVEKETEEGKTTYEAEVKIAGKEVDIEVAEDGKLISKETEGDDDSADDQDDDDADEADDDDEMEDDDDENDDDEDDKDDD